MTAADEDVRATAAEICCGRHPEQAVVVHGGARDSYQLAVALQHAGILDSLVTDLFWPSDRTWADKINARLPSRLRELTQKRTANGLPFEQVRQCTVPGLRGLLLDRIPHLPFALKRHSNRAADRSLGRAAGLRAKQAGAGLVTYSYFGYEAMRAYGRPAMLFQVHPHPATVRRLLRAELAHYPECAASLLQEWELALPEEDYQNLVKEPAMAKCVMVASSFTRRSLIENGIPADNIVVVPYGVDLDRFYPDTGFAPSLNKPLKLLFVGRINQRKGIMYLLNALRSFSARQVQLTICGRVVDDLKLFAEVGSQVQIRPSVSTEELVSAYQVADLFVFPSVVEGFGQVLLESLASGLPILSTTNTAAPDLIDEGEQGFVVEPCQTEPLIERIQWALDHRRELGAMRSKARLRAESFTWQRFRMGAAKAVEQYLATQAMGSAA